MRFTTPTYSALGYDWEPLADRALEPGMELRIPFATAPGREPDVWACYSVSPGGASVVRVGHGRRHQITAHPEGEVRRASRVGREWIERCRARNDSAGEAES